ncbi:LacI family DNA-binding transcriptional regulator [Actinocatenispora rupis]|uniref:LacI family transcriptional regulator n=1 Tax=Actinocatenispora rupis TaxID=519421 RepID=A0A8J3NCM2_9ACTN|nr:LacI family DNA-binding transcriptional regulator [Actinocatenispora rupis]GID12050.1 LacI family transcriptional regulator [Actinocatenispora rupis]
MGEDGPTIVTIAERAGVSIASVSRVLNGQSARPETTERVLAAADALGYVPNAVARSLKSRRTNHIAFAMADIGNPVYLAMVREIQQVLRAAGYRLVLHSTDADVDDELEVLRGLGQRYVDGLILCPLRVTSGHLAELTRAPVPVVVIGSVPDGQPVDSVRADSRTGVSLAVRHLYEQGRRRIGFVNGPVDTVPGAARDAGFRAALAEVGLAYEESRVEIGDFYVEGGARAADRLLARADVDALLCANDLMAVGALRTLREHGRDVPADVAVVGMDDTDLATTTWPPLTSVGLGSAERGRRAAELLIDRITGATARAGSPRQILVRPRLAVRGSSR